MQYAVIHTRQRLPMMPVDGNCLGMPLQSHFVANPATCTS